MLQKDKAKLANGSLPVKLTLSFHFTSCVLCPDFYLLSRPKGERVMKRNRHWPMLRGDAVLLTWQNKANPLAREYVSSSSASTEQNQRNLVHGFRCRLSKYDYYAYCLERLLFFLCSNIFLNILFEKLFGHSTLVF